MATQLVLYRGKRKTRQRLNRYGTEAKGPREAKYAAAAREPWLLASNLPGASARRIVNTYRLWVQIEEGFHDLKAPRNGFAFRHNMGRASSESNGFDSVFPFYSFSSAIIISSSSTPTSISNSTVA